MSTESQLAIVMTPEGKQRIEELLDRAVRDIEFRELLLTNPYVALGEKTGLTWDEKTLLFSLRRVALEEAGIDVGSAQSFLR
jgi:hypothetical protein